MKNLEDQKKILEQEQKATLEMLKEKQAEIESLLTVSVCIILGTHLSI